MDSSLIRELCSVVHVSGVSQDSQSEFTMDSSSSCSWSQVSDKSDSNHNCTSVSPFARWSDHYRILPAFTPGQRESGPAAGQTSLCQDPACSGYRARHSAVRWDSLDIRRVWKYISDTKLSSQWLPWQMLSKQQQIDWCAVSSDSSFSWLIYNVHYTNIKQLSIFC